MKATVGLVVHEDLNNWVRQLGWWHSYDGENNPFMFQTTSIHCYIVYGKNKNTMANDLRLHNHRLISVTLDIDGLIKLQHYRFYTLCQCQWWSMIVGHQWHVTPPLQATSITSTSYGSCRQGAHASCLPASQARVKIIWCSLKFFNWSGDSKGICIIILLYLYYTD